MVYDLGPEGGSVSPPEAIPMSKDPGLAKEDFLRRYGISATDFEASGLEWNLLQDISEDHRCRMKDLEDIASLLSRFLQRAPCVHSTRFRVKDPEHLLEKLIRLKRKSPEFTFDVSSYKESIKDLVGVRALHLFKGDWKPIHEFITNTCTIVESPPKAYVRKGDATTDFEKAALKIEPHPHNYRSLHYTIKKFDEVEEVQVRTIFEEGWSEIDHTLYYPQKSSDPLLKQFLDVFNHVAGTADEMGTFIRDLSISISNRAARLRKMHHEYAKVKQTLDKTVAELKVSAEEKHRLQKQIADLQRSPVSAKLSSISLADIMENPGGSITARIPGLLSRHSAVPIYGQKMCSQCGKPYVPTILESPVTSMCPKCKLSHP